MNIAVWIASVLLAAAYLFIGGTKLLKSKERLAENPSTAGAAEALSATSIKLIGGVEVAGEDTVESDAVVIAMMCANFARGSR